MLRKYFIKHQSVFIYGVSLAAALVLMKWLEWRFLIVSHAFEIYAGIIAVIFTFLGMWIAKKLQKPKRSSNSAENELALSKTSFVINERAICETGISVRELEVLTLMAIGLSNREIAEKLFLSISTIKTHLSNVFYKLEVQRRTQAVEKAKRLGLIP